MRFRALLLPLTRCATAMFYYPDARSSQLEHMLVDVGGAYASNFSSAITPCDRYVTEAAATAAAGGREGEGEGEGEGVDAAGKSGRTTSAQWLRVAFHDFVTADVEAGTGGLDASIGFETLREENKGTAFNDSLTFWRPFVNEFVSMADLVALGTVMSVNLCGDQYIPFRPGRIDALAADPETGVPAPGTTLEDTLGRFEKAGLNQTEAIQLTACGHTLGSSHHSGFPEVVDESHVSENNTNGGVNFDTTRGTFDAAVVREYVEGTGNRGGPLVTSYNESSRSDLRLYESDGNATMHALYAGGFLDICADLLARMIDTVPAAVNLGDPIVPMPVKPVNVSWDVVPGTDRVRLSGRIRILNNQADKTPITMTFSNGHKETLPIEPEAGKPASIFGNTTRYAAFAIDHANIRDVTSFTITSNNSGELSNQTTTTFPIQDNYFIIPSLSSFSSAAAAAAAAGNTNTNTSTSTTITITITVAIKDKTPITGLSARISIPVPQPLTLNPTMRSVEIPLTRNQHQRYQQQSPGITTTTAATAATGFTLLWSGTLVLGDLPPIAGAVSVRLVKDDDDDDGETLDTLLLGAGVAGW